MTLWTDDAGSIYKDPAGFTRFALNYANRPYVWYSYDGATALVSDALQLDAIVGVAYDRLRIAADVPILLYTAGEVTQNGAGVGDIGIDTRVTLVDSYLAPAGFALTARINLPTTSVEAPIGAPSLGGEIAAVLEGEVGNEGTLLVANLGTAFNGQTELPNGTVDDEFLGRLGIGQPIADDFGVSGDLAFRTSFASAFDDASTPVEGLLGGWANTGNDFTVRVGIGTGLTPGVGAPTVRALTMLSYQPAAVRDRDNDGLVDEVDQCVFQPEDFDQYIDEDGCPDPSQMFVIQVQDPDGAPVLASITIEGPDGRMQVSTHEPRELHPGQWSGFTEPAGYLRKDFVVPEEAFNSGIFIVTVEPEIREGTLELSVLDQAGAIIPNVSWTIDGGGFAPLPTTPTVLLEGPHRIDVFAEGYLPGAVDTVIPNGGVASEVIVMVLDAPKTVQITKERIDVQGTVYFETARATIKPESYPLLDDVAATIIDHPELTKVRIEGHTDSRGSASSNQRLSQARAESVMEYMIGKGLEASRLEAVGFGEDRPIDPAENATAWEKNRRVDFFIVERTD